MAVVSVPPPLQDRLGDAASEALVEMLRQLETEQEERREVQKEHLFQLLDERFLRHVVESEHRTRKELGTEIGEVRTEIAEVRTEIAELRTEVRTEIAELRTEVRTEIAELRTEVRTEIAAVRVDLGKEIADVRKDLGKEIADVRKEITIQTRWIVAVMGAAAVLIPIMQRVMSTLIP